jgi:hypothetical protein
VRARGKGRAPWAWLPLLGLLLVTCAREERIVVGGPGHLALALRFAGPSEAPADSVHLVVEAEGGAVVARTSSPVDEEGRFHLEVDLPAGGPYAAVAWTEGPSGDPRQASGSSSGLYHLGRRPGLRIRAGEVVEDTVAMVALTRQAELVSGGPGLGSYRLSWRAVREDLVEGYHVLARVWPGPWWIEWALADTFLEVPMDSVRRVAEALEVVDFWVRAETPWGPAAYGDSLRVPVGSWTDLPRVVALEPPPGSTGVVDTTAVEILFSTAMTQEDLVGSGVLWEVAATGEPVAEAPREITEGGRRLTLRASGILRPETTYRIRVATSVRDTAGRPLDQEPTTEGLQAFEATFTTEPYETLRVVASWPPDGAEGLEPRPSLWVRFSRSVDPTSLEAGLLLQDSLGIPVAVARTYEPGETLAVVTPEGDLAWDTPYLLLATPALRDLRGRPLDQDPSTEAPDTFRVRFRIMPQPPGPLVVSASPESGAVNVAIETEPVVVFDRPVDPASVTTNSFSVRKAPLYPNIPGRIEPEGDGRTFRFVPSTLLEPGQAYRIVVSPSVTDTAGIPLDQDPEEPGYQAFQADFTTEDNPQLAMLEPDPDQVEDVDVGVVLRIASTKPLDPATVDTSTVTLVRTSDGAPVPRSVALEAGGTEIVVDPVSPLGYLTTYRLRASAEIRSVEGAYLDQDPTTAEHEAFLWTFTTEVDSTPPRVVSVDPPDGATEVEETTWVTVLFQRPVKPSTVHSGTFLLYQLLGPEDSVLVSGDIEVEPDSLEARLVPSEPLATGSSFRIRVTRFVTSPYGIHLDQDPETPGDQDFTSVFATRHERQGPSVVAVSPAPGAVDVPLETTVEVWFSEPVRPDSLPAAFHLLLEGQEVPGTGQAAGDTAWVFTPAAPLLFARTYTVRVDTTVVDTLGNPLDQDPDSPGAQPFTSSFTTVPDTVGPRVVASNPPSGADSVSVEPTVELTLDEPVDPASVDEASVRVAPEGGNPVTGEVSLLADQATLRWRALEALEFSTTYVVRVETTVTDTFGNPLDQDPDTEGLQPYEGFFTTKPETLSPKVLTVLMEEPFPPYDTLRVLFSEPVDTASVQGDNVTLHVYGSSQQVELARRVRRDTLDLWAPGGLRYGEFYELQVTPGVTDTLGNPLDQDPDSPGLQSFVKDFSTQAQDNDPPEIVGFDPPDGSGDLGPRPVLEILFSEPLRASTVDPTTIRLLPDSGSVAYGVELSGDGRTVRVLLQEDLLPASGYRLTATTAVTDLHQNPLASPDTARYTTSQPPSLSLPAGQCLGAEDFHVVVDTIAASDPEDELAAVVWDWGDGTRDSLAWPEGLWAEHTYPCTLAIAACDSLDNDGDGEVDETGPSGCDESFRIRVGVYDGPGFAAWDTTGVAFCAFQVLWTDPAPGEAGVDTLGDVTVRFTQPAEPDSLQEPHVVLRVAEGDTVAVQAQLSGDGLYLTLDPVAPLLPGTTYELLLDPGVVSAQGVALDQEPCTPGPQGWSGSFTTVGPGLWRRR